MQRGYIGYQKENSKISAKYEIEYIDNKKDLDIVFGNKHPAPWELYKKKETDDLQTALNIFSILSMSEDKYDVKMWLYIYDGDEIIQECIVDNFEGYALKALVNKQMNERIENFIITTEILEKENQLFKDYIGQYSKGMDTFYHWCKDNCSV